MNQAIKERIEKIKQGEVPEGYKLTESGTIPSSWNSIKLRKLASPIKEKVQNRKLEVLSITAGVGFVNQADKFGKEIAGAQYQNYTVLRKGDFSYNKGNSKTYPQGCIYMLEDRDEAAVPSVFNSFRFKVGIHTYYYKHLFINGFLNRQLYRYINAGVRNDGLLNLYDDDFYDCELPVPPLREQEKIAEILSTWDKAILLMENLIEEKKKQKKWLMQNLLNPDSGVRLPGFEGEWENTCLKDIVSIRKEKVNSQVNTTNYYCIELEHIESNTGRILGYVSSQEQLSTKTKFKRGDILFGKLRPYLRKVAIAPFDGVCSSEIWPFKVNRKISGIYLYYYMQSDKFIAAANIATGTKMPRADWSLLKDYLITFPSVKEQAAISDILSTNDKEINLLEQKLDQLQKQKKALMQLLLTGIVRVTIYPAKGGEKNGKEYTPCCSEF